MTGGGKEFVPSEVKGNLSSSSDQKKKEEETKTVSYGKLFSFADSSDVLLMVLGTMAAMANGTSMPLLALLFGRLANSFGHSTQTNVLQEVSKVSLLFVYLAVSSGIACFLQVACWMVTGERQATRIRNLYLKAILRQEIGFFDKETTTGEVVGRMSGDTVLMQDAMGEKAGKFIQLVATFVGGLVVAFSQGWLLTLVMLCSIPPLVTAGSAMAIFMTKLASRGQAAYAEASVVVEHTIGAIRTVASFGGEKLALEKYNKLLKTSYKASCHKGFAAGAGVGSAYAVICFGYGLGVWYGGKLILDKSYSGGDVISVIFAVLRASFSLGQASPCISAFAEAKAAGYKMFETIERKPEIDAYDGKGKILEDILGEIELRDIHFSYPSRPDEPVFSAISLSIPSGTTIALVGQSGSGKSTIVSLIERFYDPQSGAVLIDGVDLRHLQLRWIRGKIGLVGQEPALFAATIRENIAYGKESATVEEIRAAAELANAAKFIDKMPNGLDTVVGENGTQLSGGQKQRIAIARAIIKDPRILLLDEATSALDAESEHVVQEALDRIMVNRTTVVVAHRLSTVRNVDAIAVVQKGVLVEQGSHDELVKNPEGAYSQLIRLQQAGRDLNRRSSTSMKIHRQPSQIQRSMSRNSSIGSISHHSLAVPFVVPVGVEIYNDDEENNTTENKELPSQPSSPPSLSRLAAMNKAEIPALLLGCISAAISSVTVPFCGMLLASIIRSFYKPPQELEKDTKFWALMFVVLGVVSFFAYPGTSYFFAVAGARLINRVRTRTFERVVNMEVAWFDLPENSSGAVGARLSADAASVRGLVGDALGLLVQNVATLLAALILSFIVNWQLSLIVVALLPVIGFNGWVQLKLMKGFSGDSKRMYEEASQVAHDAVGSIRTVASFSAEEKMLNMYRNKCEAPLKMGVRQAVVNGIGFGLSFFLLFCTDALIFWEGAKFVQKGKTSFADVFQVFFALSMAGVALSQSSGLMPDTTKAKSATGSVFAILDRKSKIDASDLSGITPERVTGFIEFKHVSFRYPSRPDIQIFQDLCLTIQAGKTVALVGESGCGKSTAIALLQRFYDPDAGHIFLDGEDIRSYQLAWLRRQMGMVGQEPVLFNESIRDNIAYGKDGQVSEAEIIAAAESANAHKFISNLQQGYETTVGERGTQLSGGQKQRVAIARAIVRDPRILLLDEATSALDAESERVVQEALDRVMVNRTTIIVAHSLSTIKGVDLIAVVKNGVIIEKGCHQDLMGRKDGAYASLVALQSKIS